MLLLLVAACARPDDGSQPHALPATQRYGGTAVIAMPADPGDLDPVTTPNMYGTWVTEAMVYTPLVRYDSTLRVRPLLAEGWDTVRVAGDSLDLTFHLRSDVKWHDGTPTTARDVAFAFERMTDPRTAFPKLSRLQGYARRAAVLNDSTLRFRLRPFPEFLEVWARVGALPEHLLRDVPAGELARSAFSRRPVGNGPFRVVAHEPGQSWTLEANRDYPAALGGRPYLDRLVLRILPEATTRLNALASGEADLVWVPVSHAPLVRSTAGARLETYRVPDWMAIFWNTRRPRLADARVRRALALALDRPALLKGVAGGYGEVGRTPITPLHWSFDVRDAATTLPHDSAAAARLLDAAGWRQREGSAVRSDAAGEPLRFSILCSPGGDPYCDLAEAVQAQLRAVGVDARIQREEFGTAIGRVTRPAGGDRGRDFDAWLIDMPMGISEDDRTFFATASRDDPFAVSGYSSPEVDSLFEAMDRTLDRERARPSWLAFQRAMARDQPATVLYYVHGLLGVGPRLRGVDLDVRGPFSGVARWWVEPSRRR